MSTVVHFPSDRVRKPTKGEAQQCAEIIIFSGVRFERLDFLPAERIAPRGGRATSEARQLDYDTE